MDAAAAQDRQRPHRVVAADRVDHDVQAAQHLGEVGLPVVDDLVGAERADQLVLGRARRADHVRPERLRDLDRDMPDAAGGGVDQHALPGLHARDLGQRLPGGEADERQRRRVDVVEAVRLAREVARRRRDVLGVAARLLGEARHAEHLVARLEQARARAGGLDHARHVVAEDRRVAPHAEAARGTPLPVGRVDAGGMDGDEDLGRAGLRARDRDGLEHVGPAPAACGDRAHRLGASGQAAPPARRRGRRARACGRARAR